MSDKDERIMLTPWGCLLSVLHDYNILDTGHITAKMGEHLVDDFMEQLAKVGYLEKKEQK